MNKVDYERLKMDKAEAKRKRRKEKRLTWLKTNKKSSPILNG